jgi:hypothetical protein
MKERRGRERTGQKEGLAKRRYCGAPPRGSKTKLSHKFPRCPLRRKGTTLHVPQPSEPGVQWELQLVSGVFLITPRNEKVSMMENLPYAINTLVLWFALYHAREKNEERGPDYVHTSRRPARRFAVPHGESQEAPHAASGRCTTRRGSSRITQSGNAARRARLCLRACARTQRRLERWRSLSFAPPLHAPPLPPSLPLRTRGPPAGGGAPPPRDAECMAVPDRSAKKFFVLFQVEFRAALTWGCRPLRHH